MKEQFTQGDWVASSYEVASEPGVVIVDCGLFDIEVESEQIANANLIAAAPKMYRELLEWVEILDRANHDVSGTRKLLAEARGETT